MPEELDTDDFLSPPPGVPIVDVRTSAEFETGHIPGACNVPLFTNDERVEIGTAYKQQGRDQAVKLGLRRVGPRLESLGDQLSALADNEERRLHLHCWRGGMRSGSVAWLMETLGCRVGLLKGGYKSFRRWVADVFEWEREVHVVSGFTGSGKTEILLGLEAGGEQVVDLEGLAKHRGSAFGYLGMEVQPSQTQFENDLALAWRSTDPGRPVWLEDESRMIGKRVMPEGIWKQKQGGRFSVIELPEGERISHLCRGYAGFPAEELESRIMAICKRLGHDRAKEAVDAVGEGDFPTACRILLRYYDRTYQRCLDEHPDEKVSRHAFEKLDPGAIAAALHESLASQS